MRNLLTIAIWLLATPLIGQVVIDRVLVDPEGNENSNDIPEIIEIVNLGDETVDLTGWTLSSTPPLDEPDVWPFFDGFVMEPGMRFTIFWLPRV